MDNDIVSFSKDWSEDEKLTIVFALRQLKREEQQYKEAVALEHERANLGLFSKVKRHFS